MKFSFLKVLPLAALLAVVGCAKDPQAAKLEYAQSGDRFVEENKLAEAVVQYRSALQIDPGSGDLRFKLARVYDRQGDLRNATQEYLRAAEALPDSAEVQLGAASAFLRTRRFEDARTRAQVALKLDPQNPQAQIMVGNALAGLRDFDMALEELEEAMKLDPTAPYLQTNIGAIQLAAGNVGEAEVAFRKGVELGPKLPGTHLALANFLWSAGKGEEAEASLKNVLAIDPANTLAHRGLATMYMGTRRLPLAEPHLKTLAEADKTPGSPLKLSLADYYVLLKKPDQAFQILEGMQDTKEGLSDIQARIAILRYEKDRAEGHRTIDEALKRDASHLEALLVKAQFQMQENDLAGALKNATAAGEAHPSSAKAKFLIGTIYQSQDRLEDAARVYGEVLSLNPRATGAQIKLAEVSLALGHPERAIPLASDVVRQLPNDLQARLTLVRAQVAAGQNDAASRAISALLRVVPNEAPVQATAGSVALARGDHGGARRAFNRALELDAANLDAFGGLILVDLAEKKADSARARIDERLAKNPEDPALLTMAARVHATTGNLQRGEEMLKKVITLEPANLQAYGMLGQIYSMQRRLPQARAAFETMLKEESDSVPLNTIVAMLYESEGNKAEARKRYERVLQMDPAAAVAANNLAYMYAEEGGNLDLALGLAQTAKSKLPDSAVVADTLGWIYTKKSMTSLAVPELESAAAKEPGNATTQYHLGVALSQAGEKVRARRALERALTLNLQPAAAAEARKIIATL